MSYLVPPKAVLIALHLEQMCPLLFDACTYSLAIILNDEMSCQSYFKDHFWVLLIWSSFVLK